MLLSELALAARGNFSKHCQFGLENEVQDSFYENIANSGTIEAFLSYSDQNSILIIILSMYNLCLLYLMFYFAMYYKREVVHFD